MSFSRMQAISSPNLIILGSMVYPQKRNQQTDRLSHLQIGMDLFIFTSLFSFFLASSVPD